MKLCVINQLNYFRKLKELKYIQNKIQPEQAGYRSRIF